MGWGDEIMVSSIAKRIHAMTNDRVLVADGAGKARWSEMWGGLDSLINPETVREPRPASVIFNGPGARHYYSGMKDNRIQWRKWDIAPGEIKLTDEERAFAEQFMPHLGRFVVLEPNVKLKGGGGTNKSWGFGKWGAAVEALSGVVNFIQFSTLHPAEIPVGTFISTPSFRHACAILERSIGYVGHEGGLHHAAAALGKKAVVVFGGYISPEVTGYSQHKNLYTPHPDYPLGCGSVTPCDHCRASMEAITVEQVVQAVKEMVK